ncbi:hypothetical protein ACJIZ3_023868 [Penstemon smallii]|uniref:Uncharacterized protein n=1 Tax=Penstemon smallii TaxID=265156 RepID=A0ABD3S5Z2_9LAMI
MKILAVAGYRDSIFECKQLSGPRWNSNFNRRSKSSFNSRIIFLVDLYMGNEEGKICESG